MENNNIKMRDVDALAVTDQIFNIWDLKLHSGRFFTKNEVASSKRFIVIGYEIYKNLFNNQGAIEKTISVGENNMTIIGVLEKQGESVIGVSRDYSVLILSLIHI